MATGPTEDEDADPGTPETSGFSDTERAAMMQRAAELKAEATDGERSGRKAAADEAAVLDTIAAMPDPDRALAERVHAIVATAAPDLAPKLYYGQPAYARGKKVMCFFRSGQADGERYSTFGVSQEANLDDSSGTWPTSYALADEVSAGAWDELAALVRRAVS
jgi:hypothetical protein